MDHWRTTIRIWTFGIFLICGLTAYAQNQATLTHPPRLPQELRNFKFETGQVIGISEMLHDPLTLFFEVATGSRIGHIGTVLVTPRGIEIVQSDFRRNGVTLESVEEFLERAMDIHGNAHYVIASPRVPLTEDQKASLLQSARRFLGAGIQYNVSQTVDNTGKTMNCSEFEYFLFQDAGLKPIGSLQTVGTDMNLQGFNGALLAYYRRLRGSEPDPRASAISPISVIKSPELMVAAATLNIWRTVSDLEIRNAWEDGGGLLALAANPMVNFAVKKDPSLNPRTEFLNLMQFEPKRLRVETAKEHFIRAVLSQHGVLNGTPYREFPADWRDDSQLSCTVFFRSPIAQVASNDLHSLFGLRN